MTTTTPVPTLTYDLHEKQPDAYLLTDQSPYKYLAYRDLPSLLHSRFPSREGVTALDFGSGAGFGTRFLLSQSFNVTGIDANAKMIEKAREVIPAAKFELVPLGAKFPFPGNSFDLAFTSFVLLEISPLTELTRCLREIARVLKPGGTLVALTSTDQLLNPARRWLDLNSDYPENRHLTSGCQTKVLHTPTGILFQGYYYSVADYQAALQEAGLALEEVKYPLGKPGEGFEWKDEVRYTAYMVLVASKPL